MSYPAAPTLPPGSNPLAYMPIFAAPPNRTSNFTDPSRNYPPVLALGGLLLAIATIFITNRLFFKFRILCRRSWDDLTLVLGYIGGVFFYGACIWGTKDSIWGTHIWNVSILNAGSRDFLVPAFLYVVLYPPTLTLIRLSFFIMYLDVFGLMRGIKIGAWVGGIVTLLFGLVMTVLSFVCATPWPSETWLAQKFTYRAQLIVKFSFPQSIVGLVLDVYVLLLPIVGVSKLQMPFRRKMGVVLIFMSAIFAVLGSLLTMVYRSKLNNQSDYTWNLMPVLTVTLLEIFIGITVACMPAANHTLRMSAPQLERIRSRIIQSKFWYYLDSTLNFRSSRRSSARHLTGSSESDSSTEKQGSPQELGHGCPKVVPFGVDSHRGVCESFAGLEDVKIPNATLVRSCLRSADRLNAADLESGNGDGWYLSRNWRR